MYIFFIFPCFCFGCDFKVWEGLCSYIIAVPGNYTLHKVGSKEQLVSFACGSYFLLCVSALLFDDINCVVGISIMVKSMI